MALVCKDCEMEIKYNQDLQRYDHVDTKYDGCGPLKGANFMGWGDGNRAEPKAPYAKEQQ